MAVTLKPGAWVDPAKMTENIRRAGYTPILTDVRLTVTGKLEKHGEALVLALEGMKTPVELTVAPHSTSPQAGPDLARSVGAVVQLEGYWTAAEPRQLAVTAVKVEDGGGDKKP
jgi:hypothetical protein